MILHINLASFIFFKGLHALVALQNDLSQYCENIEH